MKCGGCALFKPYMEGPPESWDEDEPGSCGWNPGPLPISWVYTTREVVGVSADTESECPQFKERQNEEG